MSFTTTIEAILVGNLAGFAPLIPALHAAHVRDVDAMVDLALGDDSDESVALRAAMLELTSPSELACLIATMRELRRIRGLLRGAQAAVLNPV